ncbi:MAG: hypothetical protein JO212_16990, partial [Acetobacteraceae bacterium]|nr:hypothetical protein [Acetobacteraceae bacterium]
MVFLPTGKTEFLDCLARGGLRMPDRKAWSSRSVNAALDELVREELLTETLECPAPLLHPVAVDAAASAEAAMMFAGVRQALPAQPSGSYYAFGRPSRDVQHRLIRLAIYANEESAFVADRERYDKDCAPDSVIHFLAALLAGVPLADGWLASRRPAIQSALVEAKLLAFLSTGASDADLPALIAHSRSRQRSDDADGIRPVLLHYDLLAVRLEDARSDIAAITGATLDQRRAVEGAIDFLEGNNAAALDCFREALKLLRKRLGRRKVFLDGVFAVFFLMALLRANITGLHAEIQAGLEILLSAPSAYAGAFLAIQVLLWLVQGLEPRARELAANLWERVPEEPLSAACVALASHAVERNVTRKRRADLAARFAQFQETLPLVARVYAEILAETAETPGPYRAYLRATSPV